MNRTQLGLIRITPQSGLKCPICGNNHGCAFLADKSAVLCIRVEEGCARRRDGKPVTTDANGCLLSYVHRLDDKTKLRKAGIKGKVTPPAPRLKPAECAAMQKQFATAVNAEKLEKLASSLGLSTHSLKMLDIGWDWKTACWTFPMRDGKKRIVGFRTRDDEGNKRCIVGSSIGLFIPGNYDNPFIRNSPRGTDGQTLVLTTEGPTDAAAAMDMGFLTIGRPDCRNGGEMLAQLLADDPNQNIIIIADHDETKWSRDADGLKHLPMWPGIEGALHLAKVILDTCHTLRIIEPAAKDIRDWLRSGATHKDVLDRVAKAPFVSHQWIGLQQQRLQRGRERLMRARKP